jgi:hypothetical protein
LHADKTPQRSPSERQEGAVTRELWLVRDPLPLDEQDTEVHDTLGTAAGNPRRFDWYDTEPHRPHESPAEIAAFQRRLRDLAIRRVEIQVTQEEEDLRASREVNQLVEQARSKDTGQRSRSNTVRLLREIVLLVALIWTVGLLILTSAGVPITELTPTAITRDTIKLIKGFETAIGVRHAPPAHAAATTLIMVQLVHLSSEIPHKMGTSGENGDRGTKIEPTPCVEAHRRTTRSAL